MRTLSRYYVARYLGFFVVILCGAVLAIASVELLLGAETFADTDVDPLDWVLWRIPSYYLGDLVPISSFFAAFFTVGLAMRWLEWTAAQSGGISPGRIVTPVLAASVFVAVGMGLVRETVGSALIRHQAAVRRDADEDLLYRDGAFWYQKGTSIFSIAGTDPATSTLRGVELFERTPRGRLLANVRAASATVRDDGSWLLHDAVVRRFDPERPGEPTRMERAAELEIRVSESPGRLIEQTDTNALPLSQIAEYARARGEASDPGSRSASRRLDLLVQRRLSEPAIVVALSMLAVPLALRVRPGGNLAPASVIAIAAVGGFLGLRSVTEGLAEREVLAHPIVVWAVPSTLAVIAAGLLWLRTRSARR